jgi:NADH-ubiquinone oxidoreductase chain 4
MFLFAAYFLWLFYRVLYGSASVYMATMSDISRREFFVVLPLIIVSFILGINPKAQPWMLYIFR